MSRYYKANEEVTLRFYQMPKVLFNNPRYKGLSLGAKATYSILRDRQDLSIKNNWVDEEGNIYLVFSIENLSELLEIDRKTVMKYKKELVDYGLIIDKRLGQGKANRIYVLKPELVDESIDIYKKSENGTSRGTENGLQQVQKRDTNDTELNDTNFIDTISQSVEEKKEDRPTDHNTNNNDDFFNEVIGQAQIEIYHQQEQELLKDTIRRLLELPKLRANERTYNSSSIKHYLHRLDLEVCDIALEKYRQALQENNIKNKANYFMVLLFNSIMEKSANNYY
jgi:biotin operon repressor